jgi:hypothetical protein
LTHSKPLRPHGSKLKGDGSSKTDDEATCTTAKENERYISMTIETTEIRIVFDGPPAPQSGRFIEVEDAEGKGIGVGSWVERDDGLWELRIPGVDLEVAQAMRGS